MDKTTETMKRIAKDYYGVEIKIKEGKGTDTFESLFGISLEEITEHAEEDEEEDDSEALTVSDLNGTEMIYKIKMPTFLYNEIGFIEAGPEAA